MFMSVGEFVNEVYVVCYGDLHPRNPDQEQGQFVIETAFLDVEVANSVAKKFLYLRDTMFDSITYSDSPHIMFAYKNRYNKVWVERPFVRF